MPADRKDRPDGLDQTVAAPGTQPPTVPQRRSAEPGGLDQTVAAPPTTPSGLDCTVAAQPSGLDRTVAAPPTTPSGFDRTIAAGAASATAPVSSAFDPPSVRFEERGELGRGGMGRVADAFDRALARRVAVKHMLSSDPDAVQRFAREARITAQLEHPGIVPLYDSGRSRDGTPYYVMRRIDGQPLSSALTDGDSPAALAKRLALVPNILAACDAVAYAHAHGIVHRDLKPQNILLGPFGETLVIDWGLAKSAGDRDDNGGAIASGDLALTMVGAVAGTPGYMAPEQARGELIDARGDVFALGATLFYVLAGHPPYGGDTVTQVIGRAATAQAPDWDRLPDGVPDDLRAILGKALAPDPAARYRDAGALAADLRRFVTGNLVGARHYGRLERLRRFVRRHRTVLAIVGLSLAAIAVVSVIAVRRVITERDEATRARQLETERANELALAQARLLLDKDPTRALALVKPLAFGPRWLEVRSIIEAARARGVPWRLPSSPGTRQLGVAPDGLHGYSVGDDGVIRIYDLRARTARTVLALGRPVDGLRPAFVELFDSQRIAVFDRKSLTIIDERMPARTTIELPAQVVATGLRGSRLYWIDIARRAWWLDGARPVQLAIDDEVVEVQPSPDGARFAVRGRNATWLVDPDGSHQVIDERTTAIAWHAGSRGFIAVTDRKPRVFKVLVADRSASEMPALGRWAESAAIANNQVILQSDQGVSIEGANQISYDSGVRTLPMVTARDELIASATRTGLIDVLDAGRQHRLHAPVAELTAIASSPASPYLLTAGGPLVLLWDLDSIAARRGPEADMRVVTAGPHHELLWALEGSASWLDLHAMTIQPGPELPVLAKLSPGDTRIALHDGKPSTVDLLRRGTTERVPLASGVKLVRMLDDRRAVLVTTSHRIELHDLEARTSRPLFTAPREPHRLYATGDHVVVVLYDNTAIRYHLPSGQPSQIKLPNQVNVDRGCELDSLGRLWFGDGANLSYWGVAGGIALHSVLPGPIVLLTRIDDRRFVTSTEATAYLIDSALPGVARSTIALPARAQSSDWQSGAAISTASNGLVAVPGPRGGAQLIDAASGEAWTVGQPGDTRVGQANARLSQDGSVLYERRGRRLAYWRIELPGSWLATALRAATASNAELDADDTLRWSGM